MVLQWHITDRCNQRCKHCYQTIYESEELVFEDWLKIIEQLRQLTIALKHQGVPHWRAHINVTGGEPFVHKDCMNLLEYISAQKSWLSFGIMTNGTLIDDELAKQIARLRPQAVQVSIEGKEDTHNDIRGKNNLKKVIKGIEHLHDHNVRVHVSFTAHAENYTEFTDVVELGAELGVSKIWSDRMIPFGEGEKLKHLVMTPDQVNDYIRIMHEARTKLTERGFCRTDVSMGRALQFLVGGGGIYDCGAGTRVMIVMPDGDILICRRMPISLGNVKETTLTDVYFTDPLCLKLRNRNSIPDRCRGCKYQHSCRGGLKCLAYEMLGDPLAGDPGCWVAAAQEKRGEEYDRNMESLRSSTSCKDSSPDKGLCQSDCGFECGS